MKIANQIQAVVSPNWETGTLNINLNQADISETAGSVAWLRKQRISLNFREMTADSVTFRAAELTLAGVTVPIAADGAYREDEFDLWWETQGYRVVKLDLFRPSSIDRAFPAALTPGAVSLLERIAERGREAFQRWIAEKSETEGLEIDLVVRSIPVN